MKKKIIIGTLILAITTTAFTMGLFDKLFGKTNPEKQITTFSIKLDIKKNGSFISVT